MFIDNRYVGKTDADGFLVAYNLRKGFHDVRVFDNRTTPPRRGFARFFSEGDGTEFINIDAFVFAKDGEFKNDVRFVVTNNLENPVPGVKIMIDQHFVGVTGLNGTLTVLDNPPGWHHVLALKAVLPDGEVVELGDVTR